MRADARQRDAGRGVPRRRRRPGRDAAAGGRLRRRRLRAARATRFGDAATLRLRLGLAARGPARVHRAGQRGAVRAQHDPRVPARRRADRPRDRLAAERRPPQGDHVLGLPRPGLRRADDGLRRLPPARRRRPSGGLWWLVLGWMLGGAARAAVAQSAFVEPPGGHHGGRHHGRRAGDDPGLDLPVERAYDEYFLRYQGWPWFAGRRGRRALRRARPPRRGRARRAARGRHAAGARPSSPTPSRCATDTPLETLVGSEPLRTPRAR